MRTKKEILDEVDNKKGHPGWLDSAKLEVLIDLRDFFKSISENLAIIRKNIELWDKRN